jgi:predicted RNase H-like HicB family nuclease
MHKYSVNIQWSEEDQVFIAEVPDLPGCVTHGDTHATALANAAHAIQLWIETAKEFGDPVPSATGKASVSSPGVRSKGQAVRGRLHHKRRNNPRITLSIKGQRARMNPKAH